MQLSSRMPSTILRFSLVLAALGCGDESGDAAFGALCTTFAACGGDPVGTWQARDVCLPDDFVNQVIPDLPAECAGAIELQDVSSDVVLTFGADGGFSERGAATTELAMSFSQACISAANGQAGDALLINLFCDAVRDALTQDEDPMVTTQVTCEVVGSACNCEARRETRVDTSGQFTIEGNQVVYVSQGGLRQDFCVEGDQLSVSSFEGAGLDAHVVYTRSTP